VFALEGGYDLRALEESVVAALSVMTGGAVPPIREESGASADGILAEARALHGKYWKSLRKG
jgi:acetoin utilization deacetylase AcuC-like enzyme